MLAGAPDTVWRRRIAVRSDQGPAGIDVPARELAVEADAHEPAGPEQGEQHPPAPPWVGKMMQHATCVDDVEGPIEVAEFEDICLGKGDITGARSTRLPHRIAQAGNTEIDGKNP